MIAKCGIGNAAAMREALGDVYDTLEELQPYALHINDISLRRAFSGRLCHAKNVIDAALSAPPMNCDIGTPEEQAKRMDAYCASHGERIGCGWRCENCPLCSIDRCELFWAQMPYEADNGSKEGGSE